jgi:hypothetical protein
LNAQIQGAPVAAFPNEIGPGGRVDGRSFSKQPSLERVLEPLNERHVTEQWQRLKGAFSLRTAENAERLVHRAKGFPRAHRESDLPRRHFRLAHVDSHERFQLFPCQGALRGSEDLLARYS